MSFPEREITIRRWYRPCVRTQSARRYSNTNRTPIYVGRTRRLTPAYTARDASPRSHSNLFALHALSRTCERQRHTGPPIEATYSCPERIASHVFTQGGLP